MPEPIQAGNDALRVSVLSEALPYIQRFSGRLEASKAETVLKRHVSINDKRKLIAYGKFWQGRVKLDLKSSGNVRSIISNYR